MNALSIRKASKSYPGAPAPVLDNVSLDLKTGESFVILGQTGSGKSTLLRAVAGLETLDSGKIELDREGRQAMVFQQAALFPWLTVRQNIELGTRYKQNAGRVEPANIAQLIERLGLQGLENRRVSEISGGQAQRVSIGRALAIRPSLLLLDEPFSALDPATRAELQTWLRALIDDLNLTVLMVSHDIAEATAIGDRIGFFRAHEGFVRFWEPRKQKVSHEEILNYYRGSAEQEPSSVASNTAASHTAQVAGV